MEACDSSFLTQYVDFPTHIAGKTLDLLLSNNGNLIGNIMDCGRLGTSDHNMFLTEIILPTKDNSSTEMVPDYSKADFSKLKDFLADIDWEKEMEHLSTETSWDFFKNKLDEGVEMCVPKKCRRTGNKPLWMNRNAIRLIRKKRRLWNFYKTTGDHDSLMAYKKIQAEVKKEVRKAKRTFERKLAKEARRKPRAFYAYVNRRTKTRAGVGPLKDSDGNVRTDDESMADILNCLFSY